MTAANKGGPLFVGVVLQYLVLLDFLEAGGECVGVTRGRSRIQRPPTAVIRLSFNRDGQSLYGNLGVRSMIRRLKFI